MTVLIICVVNGSVSSMHRKSLLLEALEFGFDRSSLSLYGRTLNGILRLCFVKLSVHRDVVCD